MGGLNVKNTMVERVLQVVAPHPCFTCGKVGCVLCDDCKYDITHEPFLGCIFCATPQRYGVCRAHESAIARAFVVGQRGGTLETLINKLKFERVKAAAQPLAELLNERLPILPGDCLVVPVPTVRAHIRERGYDQVDLIARHFANFRGQEVYTGLRRITNTTQHTVDRDTRQKQAREAFVVRDEALLRGRHVLLLDDIITTGATLRAAAELLTRAGAVVWVAALAYQPLD